MMVMLLFGFVVGAIVVAVLKNFLLILLVVSHKIYNMKKIHEISAERMQNFLDHLKSAATHTESHILSLVHFGLLLRYGDITTNDMEYFIQSYRVYLGRLPQSSLVRHQLQPSQDLQVAFPSQIQKPQQIHSLTSQLWLKFLLGKEFYSIFFNIVSCTIVFAQILQQCKKS